MKTPGLALALILFSTVARPQVYDIGNPTLTDIWVDPANGNDLNDGTSRQNALATLTEAWNRVPRAATLTSTGYRLQLVAGTYPRSGIPTYFEMRYGTSQFPIIIQSTDGSLRARLSGDLNIFDTRYLYLIGLDVTPDPPGDVIHCEQCDHLLIRDANLYGGARVAQETVKINQSSYVYIETSTIAGAWDNAIDFVAVQHAQVTENRISNASDWCMYAKGGSSYVRVEGNEIFDCGTGGFTAGQGSGLQFMQPPWIHYEAYDIKVINNVIHDTVGAGLGVNGGYNILLAYNTLYRIGSRSHMLEIVFGNRSCDGMPGDPGRERCQMYLDQGGWGTTRVDDGSNYVRIPSRNVFVYNNVLVNPAGSSSSQHFNIAGPYSGATQDGSNAPSPALADQNLQIRGNVIWNPGGILGVDENSGCAPSNPTCNPSQLVDENTINQFEPQFVNPSSGDFHPQLNSPLLTARTFSIPDFTWSDAPPTPPVPAGTLSNRVTADRDGTSRAEPSTAGAYSRGGSVARRRRVIVR
jgi:hypothetical protein